MIFLLGAGASADAGMSAVTDLTEALKRRLPELPDDNGSLRPEFLQIFEDIANHDPKVAQKLRTLL